jgi:RNA polymerase-interacting CarD/CdnL/TRCF family regulator
MANHTNYQKGVIRRYYDNREQIDEGRLSELVTNLYLASEKKQEKMWQTAEDLMQRLEVPESRIAHVVKTGDPAILAEVVKDLQSGKIQKTQGKRKAGR